MFSRALSWKLLIPVVLMGSLSNLAPALQAATYNYVNISLILPSRFDKTYITGINNSGQIVGYVIPDDVSVPIYGFVYNGSTYTALNAPGSLNLPKADISGTRAKGINDSGYVVGIFSNATGTHGFLYHSGTYTPLDVPGTAGSTQANGINDGGQIVGTFFDPVGTHGFLYDGSTYTTLDAPYGVSRTEARGINDSRQVVGIFSDAAGIHGFLYNGSTYVALDVPGTSGNTQANGINDSGQVVGTFSVGAASHGFVYQNGSYTILDAPGAVDTRANGINDGGQVVGMAGADPGAGFLAAPLVMNSSTLSVAVFGPGTVASTPAGIACDSTCKADFNQGTLVTLTATPAANAVFTGWSGACTGTGACQVLMNSAQSVGVSFAPLGTSVTNTWQAGRPLDTARDRFAGGVIAGNIFVFGGNRNPDGINLKSTEALSPALGSWVELAGNENNDVQAVEGISGAVENGRLYVFGAAGDGAPPRVFNFVEEYNPADNTWTSKTPMPTTRSGAVAATYDKKIYVFGGSGEDSTGTRVYYDVVEAYEPSSNTWRAVTHIPKVLIAPAVAVVADKAYVIGGGDPATGEMSGDIYAYDFSSGKWTASGYARLPHPREFSYASAAPVVNGKIYLVGGVEKSSTGTFSSIQVDIYDTASNTWQTGVPLPTPTAGQLSVVANDKLYSIGGNYGADGSSSNFSSITASVWSLDLVTPAGVYPLTVTKANSDLVISDPPGIDCGQTCSVNFPSGSVVTLTAKPVSNHVFTGWNGACSGTGVCRVTMNAAQSVGASFAPIGTGVTGTSDLEPTLTANPATGAIGGRIDYTGTLANTGLDMATAVQAAFTLPPQAEVVSIDNRCTLWTPLLLCGMGNLAVNSSIVPLSFSLVPTDSGSIGVTEQVTSASNPISHSTRVDTLIATVYPGDPASANLGLTLRGPERIRPGQLALYKLRVRNLGPAQANVVRVDLGLPAEASFLGDASDSSCGLGSENLVQCRLGNLNPRERRQVNIVLTYGNAGRMIVNARVFAFNGDPETANNRASARTRAK